MASLVNLADYHLFCFLYMHLNLISTLISTVSDSITTPVMASVPGIPLGTLASTPITDCSIQPASAAYISTRPMELGI